MRSFIALLAFGLCICLPAVGQTPEGVLARCGASQGQSYFFYDEFFNPDGPAWDEDGLSNGQIILIRLGNEWDIQFNDLIGESGYRQDEAEVLVLGNEANKITLGAFRGTYTDVYTFDFAQNEVVWSSHKIGTVIKKVGLYQADCSFMADIN